MARWLVVILGLFVSACTYQYDIKEDTEGPATMGYDDETSGLVGQGVNGWSALDQLVTGNSDKTIGLQADFTKSKAGAGAWTVQFGLTNLPTTGVQTEATILWSVAGNFNQRRVTIADGTSITGNGEGVKVVVHDVTDNADYGYAKGAQYTVRITVAPGNRGSTTNPPVLIPPALHNPSIDAGPGTYDIPPGTTNLPIPQNAGITSVFVSMIDPAVPGTAIDDTIAIWQWENGSIVSGAFGPNQDQWVPLLPGATVLAMQNKRNLGGNPVTFTVIFGIDG